MGTASRSTRTMVFAVSGCTPVLELPRAQGLELLEWLGLGRPEFGAVEVGKLLPLCRRRLWPERRNQGPLMPFVESLAASIARSPNAVVCFG
jgi:hypothetical protein